MTFSLNARGAIAASCLALLFATSGAYWPGLAHIDTMDQFGQATSGFYTDWHPPAMAALWRQLLMFGEGTAPVFVAQMAAYWLAWYLIADGLFRAGARWATIIPLVGLLPFTINFAGTIWKDTHLGIAWLLASSLILHCKISQQKVLGSSGLGNCHDADGHPRATKALRLGTGAFALILIGYGALVRVNSIAAVGFLLPIVFWLRPRIATFVLVVSITPIAFFGHAVTNHFLGAKQTRVINSLLIFDLGGISHFSKTNVFPPGLISQDDAKNCYQPPAWDVYAWGNCKFVRERAEQTGVWDSGVILAAWREAVLAQPAAYLKHRAAHFSALLRIGYEKGHRIFEGGKAYPLGKYIFLFESTPTMKPWFWFFMSLALSIYALGGALKGHVMPLYAFWMSATGAMYTLTYALIGVASDFRYVYWTVLAVLAAILALIAGRTTSKPRATV